MHTYTVIYRDPAGDIRHHTGPAISEDAALKEAFGEIVTIIRHRTPKLTLVLDGDMVQAAYSDMPVEVLVCYADKEAVPTALADGRPLMPGSRHCINYPEKADHAYPFSLLGVDYSPGLASFDHSYVRDEFLINEFTEAVREELES